MTKLSLLVAPLVAAAALLSLLGSSARPQDAPAAGTPTTSAPDAPTRASIDAAIEAYRSERTLQSAADLLDAAIRVDGARRERIRRLEAFGPANLPGANAPEVGYLLDLEGDEERLVLFDHREYPEHAALEREFERVAADPWYEADQGLLLRVEARAAARLVEAGATARLDSAAVPATCP